MMCPKCKREMEPGFIQCGKSITWVSELLPVGLGFWKKGAEVVSDELKIGVNAIPTHICRYCKLLLGDYSHKK